MPSRTPPPQQRDSLDAAIRTPHPATLTAGALIVVGVIALLASLNRLAVPMSTMSILGATGALATVVLAAAAILLNRRLRTMASAAAGLALIDAAIAVLAFSSPEVASTRGLAVLLVLPTVIATYRFTDSVLRAQLGTAIALCLALLGLVPGSRSPMSQVIETVLAAGVLVAATVMARRVSVATCGHVDDLRALALTDRLTGTLNRRGLSDAFSSHVTSRRHGAALGVVSIDIDHFKSFNDDYGHAAGDEVLQRVAAALTQAAGPRGIVARTGGEEFVALVPGPAEPVALVFHEILARIDHPRVTASVGIVDFSGAQCFDPDRLWQLLDIADRAMYEAKTTGRDRTCRGEPGFTTMTPRPTAPAPTHAAVPAPPRDTGPSASPLPGWALTVASLVGIVSGAAADIDPRAALLRELYLPVLVLGTVTGIFLVALAPTAERARWTIGIVGTDLVLVLTAAGFDGTPARMIAVMPVVLTGLMAAQHFGRRATLAHHGIIMTVYLLAPIGDMSRVHVASAILNAIVMIGAVELTYFLQRRHVTVAENLHRWSVTDPLTNLANRHGLELGFENLSRAKQLTVLALDVDDFKGINDTYGHAAGDDALVRLAATLETVTPSDAVVCRTGGDEFVVLVPEARPSALRSTITRATALLPIPLSISIGSAVAAPYRLRSLWQLVDAADAALMRAKRARRAQRRSTRENTALTRSPVRQDPPPDGSTGDEPTRFGPDRRGRAAHSAGTDTARDPGPYPDTAVDPGTDTSVEPDTDTIDSPVDTDARPTNQANPWLRLPSAR